MNSSTSLKMLNESYSELIPLCFSNPTPKSMVREQVESHIKLIKSMYKYIFSQPVLMLADLTLLGEFSNILLPRSFLRPVKTVSGVGPRHWWFKNLFGWFQYRAIFRLTDWSNSSVTRISDQIRSVAQSCPTLCDPMNRSTPGLPVHHQLPEFTETHIHQVSDAIQPSHPLLSPSPLAPNPSQHQSLFQWVNSSHEVAKVLEFQLEHHSFQRNPRADLL